MAEMINPTDEQIATINKLAIGESVTLDGIGTVTCRRDTLPGCDGCNQCIGARDNGIVCCGSLYCGPADRDDQCYVYFELTNNEED